MNTLALFAALLVSSSATADAPRAEVLDGAVRAYRAAEAEGRVHKPVLTIIDYSLPSTQKRLWVLDMKTGAVLFHELVAHGKNSGWEKPTKFSNVEGSLMSSIGVYVTGGTYVGKHGRSLTLDGLEAGFNDQARARAIVVHAADYATPEFAQKEGRLGRSWGCPALDPRVAMKVIDAIEGGSVVVGWYPDDAWLKASKYVAAKT
jgi:hypothetical protein